MPGLPPPGELLPKPTAMTHIPDSCAEGSHRTLTQFLCVIAALTGSTLTFAADAPPLVVPAGHRLVFVVNEDRPEGETYRQEYFARNLPLAKAQGMFECHSFRVDEVVAGGRNPQAASFFAWKSPEAADRFRTEPEYATRFLPRRAEGWIDLQSFYTDLEEPVTFDLNRAKHYTVAAVWLQDAPAYDTYFRAMGPLFAELGARVVLKQAPQRYESVRDGVGPTPHWIILVEWADHSGPARYMESEIFKRHQAQHDAALARIEMYRLGFW